MYGCFTRHEIGTLTLQYLYKRCFIFSLKTILTYADKILVLGSRKTWREAQFLMNNYMKIFKTHLLRK